MLRDALMNFFNSVYFNNSKPLIQEICGNLTGSMDAYPITLQRNLLFRLTTGRQGADRFRIQYNLSIVTSLSLS